MGCQIDSERNRSTPRSQCATYLKPSQSLSALARISRSMWSADNEVVVHLVCALYDNMVDGSWKLDCGRAAVALHKAVKKLRNIPLEQQIVLAHKGVWFEPDSLIFFLCCIDCTK
ncbi:hypothetical protein M405DRAFT_83044 [Rhizopogon salebrosus TDB-379]|nr:hypothetical protein M405DRAFT_83044 [Rhizopogon salebrosus TDB-379]